MQNFPTHRASLRSTQRFPRKVNYEVWGYGDRSCGGERVCARGKNRTQTRASGGAQCEEAAAAAAVEEVSELRDSLKDVVVENFAERKLSK